jgi:hypothetical protein
VTVTLTAVVVAVTLAVVGGQVEFVVVAVVVHVELDVLGLVRLPAAATVAAALAMTLLATAATVAASVGLTLLATAVALAMALLAAVALAMTLLATLDMAVSFLLAVVLLPGILGRRLAGARHHHLVPSGDLYVGDDLSGAGAEPV